VRRASLLLHILFSLRASKQLLEYARFYRVRLRSGRQSDNARPPMLCKPSGNVIPSFLASLVAIEHDRDKAQGRAVSEMRHLRVAERRAHQGHGRHPQAMAIVGRTTLYRLRP
jgi:hypothetical protein